MSLLLNNKLLLESALTKIDNLHTNLSMDQLPEQPQGIGTETRAFYNPSQENNKDGWTLPNKQQGSHTNKFFVYTPKPNPNAPLEKISQFYRAYNANFQKIMGIFEPYFSTHPTCDDRIKAIRKLEIMSNNSLESSKENSSKDKQLSL